MVVSWIRNNSSCTKNVVIKKAKRPTLLKIKVKMMSFVSASIALLISIDIVIL